MQNNIFSRSKKGFSTVEMLIAMAILVIMLSAIILVSFGSQSLGIDSQTNSEAINIAQEYLEREQALARKDFKSVVSVETTTQDIYKIKIDVQTQPDFFTKKVTATVSWPDQYSRGLNIQLSALVTNFENAVGGDTCNSVLTGNWQSPQTKNIITDFAQLVGDPGGIYPVTDVDAYQGKLYATVNNTAANTKETFFVFDISNPANPSLIIKMDNASNPAVSAGLNAVATDGHYAYVANGYGAPYTTCTNPNGTNTSCGQLQIIELSDSPPQAEVKYTLQMPNVDGTGGQAIGNSIFYKDGYIYLGLAASASGPEFHIIDVHSPSNPFEVGYWPQTGNLGSAINAIYVRGKYVYLATADSKDLIVLNITNPTAPTEVGNYNVSGGGNGKSLYTVGDNLYLGRTNPSTNPEFYILNTINPASITLSSSQAITSSVRAIVVRDYLAFLITTNNQFQIWKVDNPTITSYATPLALPVSSSGTSLDCEGNYLYAGSVDSSNRGYLSVISAP
jgi:prepilin-type N-terminal cleavage/methylation domain-containing protein